MKPVEHGLGHSLNNPAWLFLVVLLFSASAFSQPWEQPPRSQANLDALERVEIKSYRFEEAGGIDMNYGVYVPSSYDGRSDTPLVIALHGLGSGIMYMMEYNNLLEYAESYGFIVATPMGYNERGWYGARGMGSDFSRIPASAPKNAANPSNLGQLSEADVLNVLKEVRAQFAIDESRIYLIGQSMGGGGTWYLGSKYSDIWAALAPMAPAAPSDNSILEGASHLPVMVVMGDADQLVDVNVTRVWVEKMKSLNMNYQYLEVAGGSHASAGRENIGKVFEFLNQHKKNQAGKAAAFLPLEL